MNDIRQYTIDELLERLEPNPWQARLRIEPDEVAELAQSIRQIGLLHPIVAREHDERLQMASGHRRTAALRLLHGQGCWPREELVAVSIRELSDIDMATIALTENTERMQLTRLEEWNAWERYLKIPGATQKILAENIGKSQATVSNNLRLLRRLPQAALDALDAGKLPIRAARVLASYRNQPELVDTVVAKAADADDFNSDTLMHFLYESVTVRKWVKIEPIPCEDPSVHLYVEQFSKEHRSAIYKLPSFETANGVFVEASTWASDRHAFDSEVLHRIDQTDSQEHLVTTRDSILMQAKVAEIGATMGFSIWVPANDRTRVLERVTESVHDKFLEELNLGYDSATLSTIHQIDVLWLRRNAIVRAFEIEHTTAIYSGLLRMADLLALQPNIDIKLHIIADEDRQKKTIREITRPAFDSFDLPEKCSFLSYGKIDAIANHPDLRFLKDDIISSYEVWA